MMQAGRTWIGSAAANGIAPSVMKASPMMKLVGPDSLSSFVNLSLNSRVASAKTRILETRATGRKDTVEYNRRYIRDLDVVKVYKDYSILGHLDVIKRYDKQGEIEFEKIQDLIEQIFEVVIADGKGIELNTSSRAYKLKSLMPSKRNSETVS